MSGKKMRKISKKKGNGDKGGFDQNTTILTHDDPIGTAIDEMEVMIVISPSPNDLLSLRSLSEKKGMGCAIILLNARLDELEESKDIPHEMKNQIIDEYNLIFNLTPINRRSCGGLQGKESSNENALTLQEIMVKIANRNILYYRKYPEPYYFVEKPKALLAPPKIILENKARFEQRDIYSILNNKGEDSEESKNEKNNTQPDLFSNVINIFK